MTSRPKSVNFYNRSQASEIERIGTLTAMGNLSNINPSSIPTGVPLSSNYLPNSMQAVNSSSIAPPLPPRPSTTRSMMQSNYSGYNSCYSPYSRFSSSMYGPMGGMGAYGGMGSYGGFRSSPYNRYSPMSQDSHNGFIQLAEESTRPAFESIESVVDIVGSISMMLESTYHAVYSSYSAIIGVVDQFARLKDHLAEVLSFLALIRGLKYLCYKILHLLRLKKDNPSVEAAWNTATSGGDIPSYSGDKKSPLPFFMFLGLVVGAPWLMFKLLSRSVAVKKPFDVKTWASPDGRLISCLTAYDLNSNRRGELSFVAGEKLVLAPNHLQRNIPHGWILACNCKMQVGLIPRNYLKKAVQRNTLKPTPGNEVKSTAEECIDTVPVDLCNNSAPLQDQSPFDNLPDPFNDKS